jgi:hypothetical protein
MGEAVKGAVFPSCLDLWEEDTFSCAPALVRFGKMMKKMESGGWWQNALQSS